MTTTLTLIETIKIDTRKDGAISFAKVRVILDEIEMATDFRARVGEEPIVIDGDTITVSDKQIAAKRAARAYHADEMAKADARREVEIAAVIAKMDASLAAKMPSAEATAEIHAFIRANASEALNTLPSAGMDRYRAAGRALLAKHGLI